MPSAIKRFGDRAAAGHCDKQRALTTLGRRLLSGSGQLSASAPCLSPPLSLHIEDGSKRQSPPSSRLMCDFA